MAVDVAIVRLEVDAGKVGLGRDAEGVEVADDLRNAKVFVSVYGTDKEKTLKGLESASPFIRSELGKRMRMKFVPELLFRYDESVERGAHIMELLHDIEEKDEDKGSGNE